MSDITPAATPNNEQKKSKVASLLTGALILAIGIVLIICNKLITGRGVVILAGILFLITGIVNLIVYVTRKDKDGNPINKGMAMFFGWLVSIAAMVLGICMLVFISTFNALIPFIFGLLIFFGAIMLAATFIFTVGKIVRVPGWLWVAPAVMIILGIVTLTREAGTDDPLIMILTGVSMILFGFTGIILGVIVSTVKRQQKKEVKEIEEPATHDVEAKEQ